MVRFRPPRFHSVHRFRRCSRAIYYPPPQHTMPQYRGGEGTAAGLVLLKSATRQRRRRSALGRSSGSNSTGRGFSLAPAPMGPPPDQSSSRRRSGISPEGPVNSEAAFALHGVVDDARHVVERCRRTPGLVYVSCRSSTQLRYPAADVVAFGIKPSRLSDGVEDPEIGRGIVPVPATHCQPCWLLARSPSTR